MANANVFSALGAALLQGGHTLGQLTEEEKQRQLQEQERQDRLAQADRQAKFEQSRLDMDKQQFSASENERKARRLQMAIEGIAPDSIVDPTLVDQVKSVAPELMARLVQQKSLTSTPIGQDLTRGGQVGGNDTGAFTRAATLSEKADQAKLTEFNKKRADEDAFSEYMSGAGRNASYDDRAAFAVAHGQQPPPKTFADREREENADFGRRKQELSIMYPPDRFGPDARGGAGVKGDPATRQWDLSYFKLQDDTRAVFMPQLSALSKASAEDPENADKYNAAISQIQQHIQSTVDERAEKLLGPRPGTGARDFSGPKDMGNPTGDAISGIDEDVKRFNGDYGQLKQFVLQNQAALRKNGVDVPAYVKAVRDRIPRQPMEIGAPPGPSLAQKAVNNERDYAGRTVNGLEGVLKMLGIQDETPGPDGSRSTVRIPNRFGR
jgi:hypothetical protein